MSSWAARKLAKENGQIANGTSSSASTSSSPKPAPVFIHPSKPIPSGPRSATSISYPSPRSSTASHFPHQPVASTSTLPPKASASVLGTSSAYTAGKASGFVSISLNGHANAKKAITSSGAAGIGRVVTPSPTETSFGRRSSTSKRSIELGELLDDEGSKGPNKSSAIGKVVTPSPTASSFGHRSLMSKHSIELGEMIESDSASTSLRKKDSRQGREGSASSSRDKGKDREKIDAPGEQDEQFQPVVSRSSRDDVKRELRKSPSSERSRRRSDANRFEQDLRSVPSHEPSRESIGSDHRRTSDSVRRRRHSSASRREDDIDARSTLRNTFRNGLAADNRSRRRDLRSSDEEGESRANTGPESVRSDRGQKLDREDEEVYRFRSNGRSHGHGRERSRSRERPLHEDRARLSDMGSGSESDVRNHYDGATRDRRRDEAYEDRRRRSRTGQSRDHRRYRTDDYERRHRNGERYRESPRKDSPCPNRRRISPAKRGRTRNIVDATSPASSRSVSATRSRLKIKKRDVSYSSSGHGDGRESHLSPDIATRSDGHTGTRERREGLGTGSRHDSVSPGPSLPAPRITRAPPPHLTLISAGHDVDLKTTSNRSDKTASQPDPIAFQASPALSASFRGDAATGLIAAESSFSNGHEVARTGTGGLITPDATAQKARPPPGRRWDEVTPMGSLPSRREGHVSISLNGSKLSPRKSTFGSRTAATQAVNSAESQAANSIHPVDHTTSGDERIAPPLDDVPPPPPSPPPPPTEPIPDPPPKELVPVISDDAHVLEGVEGFADEVVPPSWVPPIMPAAAYSIPDRGNYSVTFDPATDGLDPQVIARAKRKNRPLPTKREIRYDGVSKGKEIEVSDPRLGKEPAALTKLRTMTSCIPMASFTNIKPYPWTVESTGPAPPSAVCISGLHALTTMEEVKRAMREFGMVAELLPKLDRKGQQMGIVWMRFKAYATAATEQARVLADNAVAKAVKTRFNGQRIGHAQVEVVTIVMDRDGSKAEAARATELARRQTVVLAQEAERILPERPVSTSVIPRGSAADSGAITPGSFSSGGSVRPSSMAPPAPPPRPFHSKLTFPPRAGPPVGLPAATMVGSAHAHLPFHPKHQQWLAQQGGESGRTLAEPRGPQLPARPQATIFNGNMASFAEDPFHAKASHATPSTSSKSGRSEGQLPRWKDRQTSSDVGNARSASDTSKGLLRSAFLDPPTSTAILAQGDSDSSSTDDEAAPLPLISPGRRRNYRHGALNIRQRSPSSEVEKRDDNVASALQSNSHDYIFISSKDLSARKEHMLEVTTIFDVPRPSRILFNGSGWYLFFGDAAGARRTTTLKKQAPTINGRGVMLQLKKCSPVPSSPAAAVVQRSPARPLPPHMTIKEGPAASPIGKQVKPSGSGRKRTRAVIQSDSESETAEDTTITGGDTSAHPSLKNQIHGLQVAERKEAIPLMSSPPTTAEADAASAAPEITHDPADKVIIAAEPKKRGWPKGKPRANKVKLTRQDEVTEAVVATEEVKASQTSVGVRAEKPRPKKRLKVERESTFAIDVIETMSIQEDAVDVIPDLAVARRKAERRAEPHVLSDLIRSGMIEDDEDLYLLRLASEAAASGSIPTLPDPEEDNVEEPALGSHPLGSARTHGYYKISETAKSAYLPQRNKAAVEDEAIPVAASGNSRSTRVATRRLVLGMEQHKKAATDTDIFQFNQLRTRKKQLKFSKSPIHDWGLYAVEAIPLGEMVIEYVGEVIRAQVADIREKWYEKIGIGSSYLFRVDDDAVVDATKKGNLGRLINHCCTPNCTAKIITINGDKKIVIYARENIEPGHEITYDYHFPLEQEKIVCLCGSAKCRGFLN